MIIKNESENLERCLDALLPVLEKVDSELVIVDTGSSDNSVEIAKKYTDRVYFYEWTNNFAAARNESLKYAEGEWFMIVDADEFLDDSNEIIRFFNSGEYKKYDAASYIQRNFSSPDENSCSDAFVLRMFKRKSGREFFGYVHETVKTDDMRGLKMLSKSVFKHWGYCVDKDKGKYLIKLSKYEKLVKKEISDNPNDVIRYSQLASIYCSRAKFESHKKEEYYNWAIKSLEKGIEKSISKGRYLLACAYYKFISQILYYQQKYNEIKKVCDLYFKFKDRNNIYTLGSDLDMYFFCGIYYFENADFENAADNFEKYTEFYKEMQKENNLTSELLTCSDLTFDKIYFYVAIGKIIESYARINDTKKVNEFAGEFLSEEDRNSAKYLCMRINDEFLAMDILEDEERLIGIVKKYSVREKSITDYLNSKIDERLKLSENKEKTLKALSECEYLEPMRLNLYKMRYAEVIGAELDWSCLEYFFSQSGYIDTVFGDVLYFSVRYRVSFDNIARIFNSDITEDYVKAMTIDKNELLNALKARLSENMQDCDVSACIIFIKLLRYFMLGGEADKNLKLEFFEKYAQISFEYISLVLNMNNLDENSAYVLPIQLREMYLSSYAFAELSDGNYGASSEYIRRISEFNPKFKELYDIVYALNVKDTICALVKNGDIGSAKELIKQYTALYGCDEDIEEIKKIIE